MGAGKGGGGGSAGGFRAEMVALRARGGGEAHRSKVVLREYLQDLLLLGKAKRFEDLVGSKLFPPSLGGGGRVARGGAGQGSARGSSVVFGVDGPLGHSPHGVDIHIQSFVFLPLPGFQEPSKVRVLLLFASDSVKGVAEAGVEGREVSSETLEFRARAGKRGCRGHSPVSDLAFPRAST